MPFIYTTTYTVSSGGVSYPGEMIDILPINLVVRTAHDLKRFLGVIKGDNTNQ